MKTIRQQRRQFGYAILGVMLAGLTAFGKGPEPRLVRSVWGPAQSGKPHNAFTDLVRFQDAWFLAFREALKHHGGLEGKGRLRVLRSADGESWTTAGLFELEEGDLRDAKLSVTGKGQLMLNSAIQVYRPDPVKHKNFAWFSRDGTIWGEPVQIGEPDIWIWSVTWHQGVAYGVGYPTTRKGPARLYRSADGRTWEVLVENFQAGNEAALAFGPDDTATCLLRTPGYIGQAKPPYTEWIWQRAVNLGGPDLLRLPDGRWIVGGRTAWGTTQLFEIDPLTGVHALLCGLPSQGDCGYPGLAFHQGELWASYYTGSDDSNFQTEVYALPCEIRIARVDAGAVLSGE